MKTYQRIKIIRQIPDALAEVVEGLMSEWKILHVTNKIGEKKKLQQREYGYYLWNWESFCLHGAKVHKSNAWEKTM